MTPTLKAMVEIEQGQLGDKRWAVIINRPGAAFLPRTLWERYATQAEAEIGAKAACAYIASDGARTPSSVRQIEEEIKRLRAEATSLLVGRQVRFHPFLRHHFKEEMTIEQVSYDAANGAFRALLRVQYSEEEAPDKPPEERWHGAWMGVDTFDWSDGQDVEFVEALRGVEP